MRVYEWTIRPVAVVQKASFFKTTTSEERFRSRFHSSLYNGAAEWSLPTGLFDRSSLAPARSCRRKLSAAVSVEAVHSLATRHVLLLWFHKGDNRLEWFLSSGKDTKTKFGVFTLLYKACVSRNVIGYMFFTEGNWNWSWNFVQEFGLYRETSEISIHVLIML